MKFPGSFSQKAWAYKDIVVAGDFHYPRGRVTEQQHNHLCSLATSHSTLIINGDYVNSFPPTKQAGERITDYKDAYETVIFHPGNHEEMVGLHTNMNENHSDPTPTTTITKETPQIDMFVTTLPIQLHTVYENILITHGHRLSINMDFSEIEWIILNHFHPASEQNNPVALQSTLQYPPHPNILICPAYGNQLTNPYTDQYRTNDFIEDITQSSIVQTFET